MSSEQKQVTPNEEVEERVKSPSEKLEENKPLGSLTPGTENKESEEIKKEIKPNTE